VRLRAAGPGDAGAVAAIWNPMIRDTAVTFNSAPKTVEGLRAQFAACAAEGRPFLLAEETGGAVVGFATYGRFRAGPGYAHTMEHTVIVSQQAHGHGVGRALMAALCEHARAAEVHSLIAAVSAENPGAVAFHEAQGFARVARLPQVGRKFGRWMDLVLLQKFL